MANQIKALPTANSWNNFWEVQSYDRLKKASFSKQRMMNLLGKYLKPGMRVLDAGCGSGFFSHYFIEQGCETYTLDYSEDALRLARELTENKSAGYLKEDLLDPLFATKYANSFDLIFSDGLFEHFVQKDQCRIMDNFVAAKSADGVIATFVPNLLTWWTPVRPFLMPGIEETPFTLDSLKNLHSESSVVECGGINVVPFWLSPDRLLGGKFGMLIYCFAR